MKTISRYIMTLALLITAVGGAWAQDADYDFDVEFGHNYDHMQTNFICRIMNFTDPGAGIKGTLELSVDGVSKGSFGVDGEMVFGSIAAIDAGDHTWSAVFKPEGGGSFERHGDFTIDKVHTSISYNGSTSINMGVGESTELDVYVNPDGANGLSYSSSDASVASITKKEYSYDIYIIQAKAAGTATITFSFAGNTNYNAAEDLTITVTVAAPEPTVEVTTNAAEEGATFTEATFDMPAFDATAEYELVRDMTVDVDATIADRIRIKKENNVYVVVTDGQLTPAVSDKISGTAVAMTATTDYTVKLQKKVEGDTPSWAEATALSVGTFRYVITGAGLYDGEITTAEFQLFEGYEVTVPAGEYATFYKDEALYVEDEDAELYTISSVNGDQAVLSDRSDAMPSNTPMLVYNKSNETKVILLIPCAEPDMAITVAPEFQGTLTGTTIAASTDGQTNYAFNGKAFVFVKNAIEVGPNKAWLSVNTGEPSNAREINLVFGNTTGIESIDNPELTIDGWYDLNGRKLQGKPTKKGIYIHNGKKVVVK